MAFKVGLLGLGTVGTGTVQLLLDRGGRHPLLQELEIYRVGVRQREKTRAVSLPSGILTTDLEAIVTDPQVVIVVEVLGGLEPARSLILKAISHGKHIVTANKAVIARYGDEIFTAANQFGVYVLLEAAVGGGIPVIQSLKQSLSVNRIQEITGIVNGTTNYILTAMHVVGSDFAEALVDAQQLGYAEADPTADIDGSDAADKIAILATLAFGERIKLQDVYCEGIRGISGADIAYAQKLGFAIKLLAIAKRERTHPNDQLQVRVHPTLVPQVHPLASVNGVYNAILIEGEPVGQVMFYGPGAGAGATASAVVSDILNIAAELKTGLIQTQGFAGGSSGNFLEQAQILGKASIHPLLACSHQDYCAMSQRDDALRIAPMAELITRFYARFLTQDCPGVIGKLGTCFGNHGVSLESVVQTGIRDKLAEIVVVTHEVCEGNFHSSLEEIRTLAAVDSIPSLLRVL